MPSLLSQWHFILPLVLIMLLGTILIRCLPFKVLRYGLYTGLHLLGLLQLFCIERKQAFAQYMDYEELYFNPQVLQTISLSSWGWLICQWFGLLLLVYWVAGKAKKVMTHYPSFDVVKPQWVWLVLFGVSVLLAPDIYRNSLVSIRNTLANLWVDDDHSTVYANSYQPLNGIFAASQLGSDYSIIAHASGGFIRTTVKGDREAVRYSNSVNGAEQSIADGKKLIELDFLSTSDGELIAGHDWPRVKAFLGYQGQHDRKLQNNSPLTYAQFTSLRESSEIKPLDIKQANALFEKDKSLILVTDKTQDYPKLVEGFHFPERLIVECFSLYQCKRAHRYGIVNTALNIRLDNPEILDYLRRNHISMVTFRGVETQDTQLFERAKAMLNAGVVTLVYTHADDVTYLQQHIGVTASAVYSDFFSLQSQTLITP